MNYLNCLRTEKIAIHLESTSSSKIIVVRMGHSHRKIKKASKIAKL